MEGKEYRTFIELACRTHLRGIPATPRGMNLPWKSSGGELQVHGMETDML
jgi:hypothetical protein